MAPTTAEHRRAQVFSRLAATLATATFLLTACGGEEGIAVHQDPQLLERAQQAIRAGQTVPLRSIAQGDWDRVHVFPGPTTRDSVEQAVGADIEMPDIHEGGIVVFLKGGRIERVTELVPYPFDGNGGSYGPDVVAAPMPATNPGWLRLSE
ncbi:hypothetical protein [Amycolatopsis thailandensis]|uniref:hypothetical protein n=1 Tax=Amycolatopsis thailandensis TaxID=589330 RepID=UPI003641C30B